MSAIKDQVVNRLTIRESKLVDMIRLKELLQKDGFKVHINDHYLVFYKGKVRLDENIF